ncbi:gp53-like domain-containing protein [Xanthomonas arboricola]|uniref:Putative tail fiber protein gp53-like C-terminal domain-containing protein n=1 Tax=Xanthomonas arboricola TaxID=56448 RepID=A0AAU9I0S1_9XANT|nr:hypothetical protein [Xanthomonas arboricola]CAE6836350.1 hypothetical protein XA1314C_37110 [Xanthomonas arboricola]CAE6836365.1 hypothetical protein XA1314C_37110 [Xanthomonas arboricola]
MSQRFYNPAPVFADLLGLEPLAGGSLQFYDQGTTTPKGTWSDSDLTVANQNPVPLDSSGRANTNIWLDGGYTVVLRAADGTSVWTRDVDDGAAGGATIPPLTTPGFLTHDFSNLFFEEFPMLPDPTGSDGKVPVSNGAGYVLTTLPEAPVLPVENFSNRVKIGTYLRQWGSSSAPASGSRQTAVSVTFPVPFSSAPTFVGVMPTNVTHAAGGQIGVPAVTAKSATGFSVQFDTDDFGQTNANFSGPIPFDWAAEGPTTA